ncbi:MAG: class I SAM-dependent RNA methyltransferase, partial [Gemmatimonadota bacterium]|nr:class I SAM-dependent RNA methyltransferase [Gemmatimonadota bacterium]
GISFRGTTDHLHRVNLWSRLANRVLVRVAEFHASTFHELERRAKKVEWARFISTGDRVRFRVTCRKSRLYHSDAVAARLLQASGGVAAAGDESDEDDDDAQLFVVRLSHDECTISADSSGALLHRRGYRQATAKAPLRETLAAAMLAGSGWEPTAPIVDPMCGAGTIPIEAAMIARGMAPGSERRFSFERWPDHDPGRWKKDVDEARDAALPRSPAPIIASDRDVGAIEATAANAKRAGVAGDLEISEASVSGATYPQPPGWIVTNPPYGLRLGETGPLMNLYSQLGHIVREGAPDYSLAMLSADKTLDSQLRLKAEEVFKTTNGGIPVRLILATRY